MKPKLGALITLVMILAMVLTGCAQPTPVPAPQPTKAPEVQPTAAPESSGVTVVIATDAAFPPMEFVDENKNIVGFDIDMMNAVAAAMGLEVEYKNTAWDGIFAGLESGDYDAILSAVTITDERKDKYDFSAPYINAGQAVVVRADESTIAGDADLGGKVVGAQVGTTGAFAVSAISGATLKEYDTIDLAFLDLVNGNLDAVVVDTPVAADFALTSDQFKGKLKIVGEPFTDEYYGLVVRKGESAEFVKAFNDGLKAIQADGTYDAIYAKWITGGDSVSKVGSADVAPAPGFPVKIAILAPLSGDVKTFGESTRDGAMLAFKEAESVGWEIEVLLADGKCDAQEAVNAANKVIFEDGVKYLLGEVCSGATIPVTEITGEAGVLQITATSTNPAVTVNEDGSTKDMVFRACFTDPFQGSVMATLATKDLGATKAGVLYDVGNDYTVGLAEYFQATFKELGGEVAVYEAYTKDDTDFSAVLGKVAAADVDVLFLPDYYAKNNLIAAQIKEKGIDAILLGGDGWDSAELEKDLFEGGYHSNHYHPADPRPAVQNFVSAYTAEYGAAPDALATLGYDAAKILLQSISEAGVDDPMAVRDAMAAIQYKGVSGDITYDEQHNPIKNLAIIKIENGESTFYDSVAPAGSVESASAEGDALVVPADPGFPVKLAILAPLSGDVKTFGESTRDGAMLAFDAAEAVGWEIEVLLADGKCDAQEAVNAANKVIFEDGVKYLLGEVCSGATIPVTEITGEAGVLQITATSTNPAVTVNEDGSTKDMVFRACFTDPFQGSVMASLAKNDLGATKAGVLYDVGNDYTVGLAEYFQATFEELGGEVAVYEAYTKDDTDFSAVLGKVAAADVDVLFLPDYYAKNNLIAAQIKEKGIDAILLGGDGWDSAELEKDLFEGGYHSNHYHPADPRPAVQNFVSAYTAKYGAAPDALATLGYDAAMILLQSISEAGVDDPMAVRDAMAAIQYKGVSGDITYDAQHNPVKNLAIIKIENGESMFYDSVAP